MGTRLYNLSYTFAVADCYWLHTDRHGLLIVSATLCNLFLYMHRKSSTYDNEKEEKKSKPGITSVIRLVSGCMQISNPIAHFIPKA